MEDFNKPSQHLLVKDLLRIVTWTNGKLTNKYTNYLPASIGAFSLGTLWTWTSPALPHIADCHDDCDYSYTADEGSWIASLTNLGCILGSFAAGFLMDTFGRKWTLTGMAVPLIIGWMLMLIPRLAGIHPDITLWIFYAGRFIQGKLAMTVS